MGYSVIAFKTSRIFVSVGVFMWQIFVIVLWYISYKLHTCFLHSERPLKCQCTLIIMFTLPSFGLFYLDKQNMCEVKLYASYMFAF